MNFFNRRFFAFLLIFPALLLTGSGLAQQKPNPKCPTIKVSCPAEVKQGDFLTFTADVKGGDPNVTPTYNWSVSASSIDSGQGTSSIMVNTTAVKAGTTITATVDVGGYDRECSISSSCTTGIIKQ
jgi:hypothetical protein